MTVGEAWTRLYRLRDEMNETPEGRKALGDEVARLVAMKLHADTVGRRRKEKHNDT